MSKFYAVKNGRKIGIFHTWDECQAQIKGYSGAEFKSFKSEDEANAYLYGMGVVKKNVQGFTGYLEKSYKNDLRLREDQCVAYVDGSYDMRTRYFGYGCLLLTSDKEYQMAGCDNINYLASMHNISGELLGAMVAIDKAIKLGKSSITIYHDLEGTERWANRRWHRNKRGTQQYEAYITRARQHIDINFVWIKGHSGITYNEVADDLAKRGISSSVHIDSSQFFSDL